MGKGSPPRSHISWAALLAPSARARAQQLCKTSWCLDVCFSVDRQDLSVAVGLGVVLVPAADGDVLALTRDWAFESLPQCFAGTAPFPLHLADRLSTNPSEFPCRQVLEVCASAQPWCRASSSGRGRNPASLEGSGGGWGCCFPISLPHTQGRAIHSSSSLRQDQ